MYGLPPLAGEMPKAKGAHWQCALSPPWERVRVRGNREKGVALHGPSA